MYRGLSFAHWLATLSMQIFTTSLLEMFDPKGVKKGWLLFSSWKALVEPSFFFLLKIAILVSPKHILNQIVHWTFQKFIPSSLNIFWNNCVPNMKLSFFWIDVPEPVDLILTSIPIYVVDQLIED